LPVPEVGMTRILGLLKSSMTMEGGTTSTPERGISPTVRGSAGRHQGGENRGWWALREATWCCSRGRQIIESDVNTKPPKQVKGIRCSRFLGFLKEQDERKATREEHLAEAGRILPQKRSRSSDPSELDATPSCSDTTATTTPRISTPRCRGCRRREEEGDRGRSPSRYPGQVPGRAPKSGWMGLSYLFTRSHCTRATSFWSAESDTAVRSQGSTPCWAANASAQSSTQFYTPGNALSQQKIFRVRYRGPYISGSSRLEGDLTI
jgi:hypothetical protein